MNRLTGTLMLLVAMGFAPLAVAQVTPLVEAVLEPEEVAVGESATFRVTVLVPTWFTGPPEYPSFELPNAIVRLPADSSYPTNERVDGETWSGIVREYQVTPMVGARFRFEDRKMVVRFPDPDTNEPVETEVTVPAVELLSTVPPGAENLQPYIGGKSMVLEQTIEGELEGLEAGDAVVVRYTATLDGMPSNFLPPLAPEISVPGLRSYADEPVFSDEEVASRSERVTYLFEGGGDFEIPGLVIDWWNLEQGKVESAITDAIVISVAGEPATDATTSAEDEVREWQWRRLIWPLFLLALLVAAGIRYAPRWLAHRQARRIAYEASEGYAYQQVCELITKNDPAEVHASLMRWQRKAIPRMSMQRFADAYGNSEFSELLGRLGASLYAGRPGAPNLSELGKQFSDARSRWLQVDQADDPVLPPLNP